MKGCTRARPTGCAAIRKWYAAQNAVTPGFSYYDPVAPTSDRDYLYDRNEQYKEIALFGELTYHLTPKAQITGGARVFQYTDSNQLSVMPDLPTRQPWVSPVTPDVSKTKSIFKLNGLVPNDRAGQPVRDLLARLPARWGQ